MFTKDKVLKFLMVLAVFAAADLWIYTTLRSSVRTSAATTRTHALGLLAMSAPADPALTDDWLKSVDDSLPGGSAVYLVPSEADPDVYEAHAIDEGALSLWNTLASTPARCFPLPSRSEGAGSLLSGRAARMHERHPARPGRKKGWHRTQPEHRPGGRDGQYAETV